MKWRIQKKFICRDCCSEGCEPCVLDMSELNDSADLHCPLGSDCDWQPYTTKDDLKVGDMVCFSSEYIGGIECYGKITKITENKIFFRCYDRKEEDWVSKERIKDLREARLRPWTMEEVPELPFEIREQTFRGTITGASETHAYLGNSSITYQALVESEWRMTDGMPCGVLEYKNSKGEWVR